jgi:hypothetical protein
VLCGARRAVEGRQFAPWLLDDLRAAPQDLAVAWRARGADRPARRTGRAAGDGALRGLPRLLDVVVAGSIAAAVTGFVHVGSGALPVVACAACLAHLGASNLARRELRRIQFRSWWRADVELPIEGSPDRRVVGLSPHGFDVVGRAPFTVGDEVVAPVALPGTLVGAEDPDGVVVDLVGRVQRAAVVPEGGAAYVRFDGLDATVEDAVLVFLGAGACTSRWRASVGSAGEGAVRPMSHRP